MHALSPTRPPRVSKALSRRIDRLSRAAHRFHRFAHHPLCDRYAAEVFHVSRRGRLCKGCTLTLGGALLGAALAPVFRLGALPALAVVALGVALAVVSLLRPVSKWLGRFVPALAAPFVATRGLAAGDTSGVAFALVVLALATVLFLLYRRRGPNRSPCSSCPERDRSPCSGYLPIVRRERALLRITRPLLAPDRL